MAEHRLLIVLDDAFDTFDEVPGWIVAVVGQATHVHLLAPFIASRVAVLTDDDKARARSRAKLKNITDQMTARGVTAEGTVSADGTLAAVQTALLLSTYDQIVIGLHADGHWREKGLLDKLRASTNTPIVPVIVTHTAS